MLVVGCWIFITTGYGGPSGPAASQARRFVVDSSLEAWVDVQNVQKGINPAPGNVMGQASVVKRHVGVEHPANRQSCRRWLQRWLRRCGIQPRHGIVRERLSVDQMQGKVTHGAAQRSIRCLGWFWLGGVESEKMMTVFRSRNRDLPSHW